MPPPRTPDNQTAARNEAVDAQVPRQRTDPADGEEAESRQKENKTEATPPPDDQMVVTDEEVQRDELEFEQAWQWNEMMTQHDLDLRAKQLRQTRFAAEETKCRLHIMGQWETQLSDLGKSRTCNANLLLKYAQSGRVKTHYEWLQVHKESTAEGIRLAHRRQALAVHPDKIDRNEVCQATAKRLFERIREAYEVLSNPVKRAQYDSELLVQEQRRPHTSRTWNVPQTRAESSSFQHGFSIKLHERYPMQVAWMQAKEEWITELRNAADVWSLPISGAECAIIIPGGEVKRATFVGQETRNMFRQPKRVFVVLVHDETRALEMDTSTRIFQHKAEALWIGEKLYQKMRQAPPRKGTNGYKDPVRAGDVQEDPGPTLPPTLRAHIPKTAGVHQRGSEGNESQNDNRQSHGRATQGVTGDRKGETPTARDLRPDKPHSEVRYQKTSEQVNQAKHGNSGHGVSQENSIRRPESQRAVEQRRRTDPPHLDDRSTSRISSAWWRESGKEREKATPPRGTEWTTVRPHWERSTANAAQQTTTPVHETPRGRPWCAPGRAVRAPPAQPTARGGRGSNRWRAFQTGGDRHKEAEGFAAEPWRWAADVRESNYKPGSKDTQHYAQDDGSLHSQHTRSLTQNSSIDVSTVLKFWLDNLTPFLHTHVHLIACDYESNHKRQYHKYSSNARQCVAVS